MNTIDLFYTVYNMKKRRYLLIETKLQYRQILTNHLFQQFNK